MGEVKNGRVSFTWLRRHPSIDTWEGEILYDARARGMFVAEAAQLARERGQVVLNGGEPWAGFVFKRRTTDAWEPCREQADGAVPAWIWYAR